MPLGILGHIVLYGLRDICVIQKAVPALDDIALRVNKHVLGTVGDIESITRRLRFRHVDIQAHQIDLALELFGKSIHNRVIMFAGGTPIRVGIDKLRPARVRHQGQILRRIHAVVFAH